jgi:hypothetical protein
MSKASLELGGGNWAAKDRKLLGYAVGDTSGKYIPREFDFTRNSDIAATRINKDGLIEKHRENVLLNSDDFSIAGASDGWGKNNATVTSGYAGYDGTTNAWKLESTVLTSYNNLNQNETNNAAITPLGSKVSTFSVYLKAGTTNWVRLNLNGTGNVYFDLGKGQVGTASSGNVLGQIEKAGNGFYRCSITRLSGSAFDICYIYLAESDENLLPNTHSTPEYIFVQHPQLEYGLVATDYLESGATTGKAGVLDNLPRIDYTSGSASLLLEPQRKNEISHSEYGGGYEVVDSNVTVTDNAEVSPEGLKNAVKIEGISTSSATQAVKFGALESGSVVGRTFTGSLYIKPVDSRDVGGNVYLSIQRRFGDFEASTEAIEIDSADWKRYEITYTFTGAGSGNQIGCDFKILSTQTPIDDIYVYGVQLEEGSYPTSYIPTYGTSVTRNVDVADGITINTNANHTMLYDLETTSGRESTSSLVSVGYDVSNRYFIKGTSSSNVQLQVSGIGVFSGNINPTNEVSGRNKIAVQWIDGTGYLYCNGVKQIDTLSNSSSSNDIDYYELSGSGYSHKTHQFLIFPTALTDSECIALTTL